MLILIESEIGEGFIFIPDRQSGAPGSLMRITRANHEGSSWAMRANRFKNRPLCWFFLTVAQNGRLGRGCVGLTDRLRGVGLEFPAPCGCGPGGSGRWQWGVRPQPISMRYLDSVFANLDADGRVHDHDTPRHERTSQR